MGKAALLLLFMLVCKASLIQWDDSEFSHSATVAQRSITILPFVIEAQAFAPGTFLYYDGATVGVTTQNTLSFCTISPCGGSLIGVSSQQVDLHPGLDSGMYPGAFVFDLRSTNYTGWISADVTLYYRDVFTDGAPRYSTGVTTFKVYVDPPTEAPEPSTLVLLGSILTACTAVDLLTRLYHT